MSLIFADNIQKDYKTGEVVVKALKGLSFEIAPASFVSFVDPSGYKSVMIFDGIKERKFKDEVFTLTFMPNLESLR